MTALAQVLQGRGIEVSGSDTKEKFFTDQVLARLKIKAIEGFKAENLPSQADLIIASAAYLREASDNPEVQEAQKRKLPLFTYAQILGCLFKEKYGLAVAGTHGKSTVSAMLGLVLEKAGLDPTVIVGSQVRQWRSNARVGQSKYLVAEADEYRDNFLEYQPEALILTNLEYDHPDFFKDFADYQKTFRQLVKRIPASGFIVTNKNNRVIQEIVKAAACPIIGYESEGEIELKLPGRHNLENAAAVLAVSRKLGIDEQIARKALSDFQGISRRFEIVVQKKGLTFIDDYAHHPTEVKAALQATREKYPSRKVWAVFQPHTFSRTKALLQEFAGSFQSADQVVILDIYGSAREQSGQIHSRDLVQRIKEKRKSVAYIPTIEKAKDYLKERIQSGDIVITLGAGDVWKLSTGFPF